MNAKSASTNSSRNNGISVSENYFVSAEGVLGLRANVEGLKWSWGIKMPHATKSEYEQCAIRIRLVVGDVDVHSDPKVKAEDFGKYHYFGGLHDDDSIYYERTFLGKRKLQLRITGLTGDEPTVYVNRDYLKFITHRFMNLHSVGYILTDIVSLLLLRNGYTPLHCSGFRYGDDTVLILAPPNTGKTLTAMMACIDHGADFLAEDLAISDGKNIFSVPWTSTFRYYDQVDTTRRSKWLNKMTAKVPPLELLGLGKVQGIDTLVAKENLLGQALITHVVILERGQESVVHAKHEDALRKAINLNRYEFNYVKAPSLVAYEFFNPEIDLFGAENRERELLSDVIDNAKERLIVSTDDATRYASLIIDHLKKS